MAEYRLTQEIIKRSASDAWDKAKLEWELLDIYKGKEAEACLCGHYPILEICVLKNKKIGGRVIVGNCCVNKFMGIDSNKLFTAIERVQNKQDSSLNSETIEFAKSKGWINSWEANFYLDIWRKKEIIRKPTLQKNTNKSKSCRQILRIAC